MNIDENIPAQLRAVADRCERADLHEALDTARALATAAATLRMAAVAWPVEPAKPPRPPAYRDSVSAVERVNRARASGTVAHRQALADALDDAHETGRQLGFEQGMAKAEEYTAAASAWRCAAERRGEPAPAWASAGRVARVANRVVRAWASIETVEFVQTHPALAHALDDLRAAFQD